MRQQITILTFLLLQGTSYGQTKDSIWLKEVWGGCTGSTYCYMNRDEAAHGKLIDYHSNGNIHIIGTFIFGSIRDTFRMFYENGQLAELNVVKEIRDSSRIIFKYVYWQYNYESGQTKQIIDRINNYEKKYYQNGQLESYILSNGEIVAKKWYENGNLKQSIDGNKMVSYDTGGQVILYMRFKNPNIIRRLFTNTYDDRQYYYSLWDSDKKIYSKGKLIINRWTYSSYFGDFPSPAELQVQIIKLNDNYR